MYVLNPSLKPSGTIFMEPNFAAQALSWNSLALLSLGQLPCLCSMLSVDLHDSA
jgi:hypothetical protein